ncbi:MAG: NTP transferase domain-containing protein [Chloroflexi bacterium]|nr:NTP transferase domain-containing protein [Chloroflexota bacterium]
MKVLAFILAGGRGERLSVLTDERAKPAMPFAGKYRIIDFTLSNCANSGIRDVAVLTQYQPLSLADHIGIGASWGLSRPDGGIRTLQPYLAKEEERDWYKGTADAVYQNLRYVDDVGADLVLILSGDHVYRMDYRDMVKFHTEAGADVTLAVTPFPREELRDFGTVVVSRKKRVTCFEEKVEQPKSNMVSMGVYLFNREFLRRCLEEDPTSRPDFGRNVLPRLAGNCRFFAYRFNGYWRDVGTLRSYWRANMELLEGYLPQVFCDGWPIRTREDERPPSLVSDNASMVNSLISNGCVIKGSVTRSVLSPGVVVAEGAVVRDSVIMSNVAIGSNSMVISSILDKEVAVGEGCHIGGSDGFRVSHKKAALNAGLTVVGKRARIPDGMQIGRNCSICCNADLEDYPGGKIRSGAVIRQKRRS